MLTQIKERKAFLSEFYKMKLYDIFSKEFNFYLHYYYFLLILLNICKTIYIFLKDKKRKAFYYKLPHFVYLV
jgi:hypothetical protein